MSLPRFPQPFVEQILLYLDLRTALRLLSVDKRERNGRAWLLNQHFVIAQVPTAQEAKAFSVKYPNALIRMSLEKVKSMSTLEYLDLEKTRCIKMLATDFNDNYFFPRLWMFNCLTHLHLNNLHKPSAIKDWPPCITHLSFGNQFHHALGKLVFPKQLEYLGFGSAYRHSVEDLNLPETLQMLVVGAGDGLNSSMSIGFTSKAPWNGKLGLPVPPKLKIVLVHSVRHLGKYNRNFTRLKKYVHGTFTLIDIEKCKLG